MELRLTLGLHSVEQVFVGRWCLWELLQNQVDVFLAWPVWNERPGGRCNSSYGMRCIEAVYDSNNFGMRDQEGLGPSHLS